MRSEATTLEQAAVLPELIIPLNCEATVKGGVFIGRRCPTIGLKKMIMSKQTIFGM